MHGIVSLLDTNHYQIVENLWDELDRRFNVRSIFVTRIPHFSYHVADEYDFTKVEKTLAKWARVTTTFRIKATGLGIFSGKQPIIYVPLVRNAALAALHRSLWAELNRLCNGRNPYYAPDIWMPHITLGHDDITSENLGPIVQWLNQQNLNWEISINNFAIIRDPGAEPHKLMQRFDFRT